MDQSTFALVALAVVGCACITWLSLLTVAQRSHMRAIRRLRGLVFELNATSLNLVSMIEEQRGELNRLVLDTSRRLAKLEGGPEHVHIPLGADVPSFKSEAPTSGGGTTLRAVSTGARPLCPFHKREVTYEHGMCQACVDDAHNRFPDYTPKKLEGQS